MRDESPERRWSFIRKVYMILGLQLLLTIAVVAVFVTVRPISHFFLSTKAGLAVYIVIIITLFIVMFALFLVYELPPWNYFILGVFTMLTACVVGVACAYIKGNILVEAVLLTAVVVVSLTLYTFWAARRGHDFNFLGPFLSNALIVLILFGLIQIIHPLGRFNVMIYSCVSAIIFCGYIIYDTNKLMRLECEDYIWIWAALQLYF